ncbi:hypothetical protein [Bradyrhizobium sp. 45]|uniref:hypothetical protein n=1 Tax=Bradyrhizobium sp. 45 TaxID=1043587 RepID=UPI001FFB1407|nr:hypothetical protein [Bradyrhizobium sp. 45]MCK1304170.1 hypothetical protein [Bradyrhizobium sp. 45]
MEGLPPGPFATFGTIVASLVTAVLMVARFFAFLVWRGLYALLDSLRERVVYVLLLGIGKVANLPMRNPAGFSPAIAAVATLQMLFAAVVIVVGAIAKFW